MSSVFWSKGFWFLNHLLFSAGASMSRTNHCSKTRTNQKYSDSKRWVRCLIFRIIWIELNDDFESSQFQNIPLLSIWTCKIDKLFFRRTAHIVQFQLRSSEILNLQMPSRSYGNLAKLLNSKTYSLKVKFLALFFPVSRRFPYDSWLSRFQDILMNWLYEPENNH